MKRRHSFDVMRRAAITFGVVMAAVLVWLGGPTDFEPPPSGPIWTWSVPSGEGQP